VESTETAKEEKKVRYKAIRYAGRCAICGKPMKKGQWIQEGFIYVAHLKCYRKQRSMIPKIDVTKLLQLERKRRRK